MKKNKFVDKDGNITYDEPKIYNTHTHEIQTQVHYHTEYVSGGGGGFCKFFN